MSAEAKLCECGCGEYAAIDRRGNPNRFVRGHQSRNHSPEVRRAIADNTRRCLKGRKQDPGAVARRTAWSKGHTKSPEHRRKLSAALMGRPRPDLSGPSHYNWKGGITPEREGDTLSYRWSKAVKRRDNYICQRCGKNGPKADMHAHHLWSFRDFPAKRYDVDNGITLCRSCHYAKGTHRTPVHLSDLFFGVEPAKPHTV